MEKTRCEHWGPRRRQPNDSSQVWLWACAPLSATLTAHISLWHGRRGDVSSPLLGLFHVPGPCMATLQIRGAIFPLASGPHHLLAVRTLCGSCSGSWPVCYIMAMCGSTWSLKSIWRGHQSCQQPLGSHSQPPPPMNSNAGPDQAMWGEVEKMLKSLTYKLSMMCWAWNNLLFTFLLIFSPSGQRATIRH